MANMNSIISGAYDTDMELGALYAPEETVFRVWAPSAERVVLNRYAKGSSGEEGDALLEMIELRQALDDDGKWANGVWTGAVSGDLHGTYYTYAVTVEGQTNETIDVYAKAAGVSGGRGMVVNLEATNPEGWEQDTHVCVAQATDAIVWEVHVKDFSSDPKAGFLEADRGRYLAFTEKGTKVEGTEYTTGVDYLKELGVNYVQLLPVADQRNDETGDAYNWGYEPLNYNVPEGQYSSNPYDGAVRIREFKQMVQALHEAGIGVIMDVVFNHVSDALTSPFHRTVPGYYFRQDTDGSFFGSGSACGNETASERGMFRRYMIDSVCYWAEEYHIDGFRFDLMGCHDIETMNQIRAALNRLEDGERLLMYGEPWAAGQTHQPAGIQMAVQSNVRYLDSGIGAFNDGIRDAVKGHVFYDKATAFVQGGNGQEQPLEEAVMTDEKLMAGLQGNANPAYSNPWSKAPVQTISYVSCHDNLCLYDKLVISAENVTVQRNGESGTALGDSVFYERKENLVRMNRLAAVAYLTAQGKVFLQAGEEFARSKGGDDNSYNTALTYANGREWNQINWSRRAMFADLNDYYRGLIALRKAYAPFRAADMTTIANMTFSDLSEENLIAYTIASPGAAWDMVAVLLNANREEKQVTLRTVEGMELPERWVCVVNQEQAGTQPIAGVSYEGSVITVPPQTALVLTAQK